jgi:hypothetical protein
MQAVRNALLMLGIVFVFSFASAIGGLMANRLPHFVASDSQSGSIAIMHVVGAVPSFVAAAIAGCLAAIAFALPHQKPWSGAALVFLVVVFVGSYGRFFWRSGMLSAEDLIGVLIAVFVLGACYFAAQAAFRRISFAR